MKAVDCIVNRRSVRKFAETPVPREVVQEIVDLARFSPSWKNQQVVRYHVIENAELKNDIADKCVCGFEFNAKSIRRSAALVLVTVEGNVSGFEPDGSFSTCKGDGWEMFDAGVASQTFCLAAHAKGVATVILGIFEDSKVKEVAKLPEGEKMMAMIAMGYPAEEAKPAPPRKTVDEILFYD